MNKAISSLLNSRHLKNLPPARSPVNNFYHLSITDPGLQTLTLKKMRYMPLRLRFFFLERSILQLKGVDKVTVMPI